jgi:4'-phosphopantetheinyl transferase EntD
MIATSTSRCFFTHAKRSGLDASQLSGYGAGVLEGLFPEDVATAWGHPGEPSEPLFPEEEALVRRAVDRRRREFAKGRQCARIALRSLGHDACAVLAGENREPLWPHGVVGSISHTTGFCAAAVARRMRYLGIGIDVELAGPLRADVVRRVCRDDELGTHVELDEELVPRLVFSAKEAVYKCVFPTTRTFLGFSDVRVTFAGGGFTVQARNPSDTARTVSRIAGRWRLSGAHILTAAWLTQGKDDS